MTGFLSRCYAKMPTAPGMGRVCVRRMRKEKGVTILNKIVVVFGQCVNGIFNDKNLTIDRPLQRVILKLSLLSYR